MLMFCMHNTAQYLSGYINACCPGNHACEILACVDIALCVIFCRIKGLHGAMPAGGV